MRPRIRFPSGASPLLLLAMTLLPKPLPAQDQAGADRWNRAAQEWIELLRTGAFEAAGAKVDPAAPPGTMGSEQLATIWGQLSAQLGELQRVTPGSVTPYQAYHLVDLPASFQRQEVVLRVVLNDSLQVSGFFVRPPEPPAYEPPSYVDADRFQEVDIQVGSDPWMLPGVLTLPRGEGPFPGVVLVHGSGPNDRDETIGGNRPFRDLAWGLATRGIAVLRYDKRTRVHGPALPKELGLEEEVVDDALAALSLLRARPEVDRDRVFVLGHSLGAMLAPDIGLRDGHVAGVVVAAAPLRPFLEVLRSQLEYVGRLQADTDPAGAAQVDSLLGELRRLEEGRMEPGEVLLGAPARYWRELASVDPLASARRLDVPLLILQGGRDYQSTPRDLELWREGLAGKANVTTRLYPGLNHLFAPGEGTATPEEYSTTVKHVDPQVIEDLAGWIQEGKAGPPAGAP